MRERELEQIKKKIILEPTLTAWIATTVNNHSQLHYPTVHAPN